MYKFYIFTENTPPSGPFSATEIKEMNLEKGTFLSELTINDGEPTPIEEIDIDYLCGEESDTKGTSPIPEKTNEQAEEEQPEEEQPSIIGKWNWGAFALPAIWGLFNGVYWPVAVSIVAAVASHIADNNENMEIIYYSIFAILLAIRIILGINGNKMAWKSARKHQKIQRFEASQKVWGIIGLASLATSVLATIIICMI